MRNHVTRNFIWLLTFVICALPIVASATEHSVSIPGIKVVNDGSYDMVVVTGTFSPALPCPKQGFWIYPTESKFKEIYSMLLAVKATGGTLTYTFVYCHENGYARGNIYNWE